MLVLDTFKIHYTALKHLFNTHLMNIKLALNLSLKLV